MIKILTSNVRTADARDGDNSWELRRELCASVIRQQKADVIGFQEMRWQQFCDLRDALADYDHRVMVDHATTRNPQNAIFFRRDRFVAVSAAGYWLSETPHVAGSRSWDSAHVRYANWVRLEDRDSGLHLRVVNTHLDNKSQQAREEQARLLAEDAAAYPDDFPQILMGDMNADAANPAMQALMSAGWCDSYHAVHGTANPSFTFHAFQGVDFDPAARLHGKAPIGKIDWIYSRGPLKPIAAEIVKDSRDGRYPSDHFFVSATFALWTNLTVSMESN